MTKMDQVFDWCVNILVLYAHRFNITYKEINVWIFCIIEPIIFFLMLFIIIKQFGTIRMLKTNKQ